LQKDCLWNIRDSSARNLWGKWAIGQISCFSSLLWFCLWNGAGYLKPRVQLSNSTVRSRSSRHSISKSSETQIVTRSSISIWSRGYLSLVTNDRWREKKNHMWPKLLRYYFPATIGNAHGESSEQMHPTIFVQSDQIQAQFGYDSTSKPNPFRTQYRTSWAALGPGQHSAT
jgi:hypothetical protein